MTYCVNKLRLVIERAGVISKSSLRFLHLTLFLLSIGIAGESQSESDTLKLAAFERPPFVVVENGEVVDGIDYLLARKLAKRLGLKLEVGVFPWPRVLRRLKSGKADIGSSVLWTREREQHLHFLQPPTPAPSVIQFYMLTGKRKEFRYYEDNYSLRIGLRRFALYFPKFDNDSKVNKIFVNEDLQLPKMLLAGRLDAFIGRANIFDHIIKKEGYEEKIQKSDYRYTASSLWYFVLSKRSKHAYRLKEFNQIFEEINAEEY